MQNKEIKKTIALFILTVLIGALVGIFSACNNIEIKYDVVCTIFPQYDFCRQILGSEEGLALLLDYGKDAHSYELNLTDKKNIENSKVFFYIGGESEKWVDDVKISTQSTNVNMICLSEGLDLIPLIHSGEDIKEQHEHTESFDEHVFLSIKNSIKMCKTIYDNLCKIYPNKKEQMEANYNKYISELTILDTLYTETITNLNNKIMIMADRFPFIYTARDYGINCYAAFDGCSSDMEITIGKKIELQKKYSEMNLPGVFIIENGNRELANSIMGDRIGKIYELHSCQTVTKFESENDTYLTLMRKNLNTFVEGMTIVN